MKVTRQLLDDITRTSIGFVRNGCHQVQRLVGISKPTAPTAHAQKQLYPYAGSDPDGRSLTMGRWKEARMHKNLKRIEVLDRYVRESCAD